MSAPMSRYVATAVAPTISYDSVAACRWSERRPGYADRDLPAVRDQHLVQPKPPGPARQRRRARGRQAQVPHERGDPARGLVLLEPGPHSPNGSLVCAGLRRSTL